MPKRYDPYAGFKKFAVELTRQISTPNLLVLTVVRGNPAKSYLIQQSFDRGKTWNFVWVMMGDGQLLVQDVDAKWRALEL